MSYPIDVDECFGDPCENGGECTDGINGFTCQCLDGYKGITCQTGITAVSSPQSSIKCGGKDEV